MDQMFPACGRQWWKGSPYSVHTWEPSVGPPDQASPGTASRPEPKEKVDRDTETAQGHLCAWPPSLSKLVC